MINLLKGAVGVMNGYVYIYICVAMVISTLNWNCNSKYRIGFLDISRKTLYRDIPNIKMWESMLVSAALSWWSKVSHEPLQSTGLDSQKTDPGGTSVFFWISGAKGRWAVLNPWGYFQIIHFHRFSSIIIKNYWGYPHGLETTIFLVFNWTEVLISYGTPLVSWMTTKNEELPTCVIKRGLLENHRTGGFCRWEKNGKRKKL